MVDCFFELNGKPMSTLAIDQMHFPAFSGLGRDANRRELACLASAGPIPPGTYYIFDRQSGGLLGPLRDLFHDHSQWFALYAIDGKINDETFCNQVKRGAFRLHPRGVLGISQGCITLDSAIDFQMLRARLKVSGQTSVPGSNLKAYGRVIVK
jgi:hypothetical protein